MTKGRLRILSACNAKEQFFPAAFSNSVLQVMVQCNIIFSGQVQGVGFRYTARDIARGLGLQGSVRNLPDGRVELIAEGPEAVIEDLVRQLENSFLITGKKIACSPHGGRFEDFEIRF
jgi:acylphosphatase